MNERIRDIALECSVEYIASPVWAFSEAELIKFAHMIIQECIKEIGYKSVELLDVDLYQHYQERLKKHFGVEL